MTPMRKAVVLFADKGLFPAAMFAAHRLAALKNRDDTDIVVFTDAEAERLAAEAMGLPFQVAAVPGPTEIGASVYFVKLYLPSALGKVYDRLVYIDVDTYVEDARLFSLFDLDMDGLAICGVRDLVMAFRADSQFELDATLRGRHRKYLNAGVLLIDRERYERANLVRRAREAYPKFAGRRGFGDQSVFNYLLNGAWLELSPAFNFFSMFRASALAQVTSPSITHFAGAAKPWHGVRFGEQHPARGEMARFFPTSAWPDFLPRFFNLRDALDPDSHPPAPNLDWAFGGETPLVRYLRETQFADVAAGLTELHLDRLSAPPAGGHPT